MDGIKQELFTATEAKGLQFPFIQATNYSPVAYNKKQLEKLDPSEYAQMGNNYYSSSQLALSAESYDMLEESEAERLEASLEAFTFGNTESNLFVLPADARFVILCQPKIFKLDKDTKEVTYLQKGDKLAGTSRVTVARVFLALFKDDKLITDKDGLVQVFTLRLTSSKTSLLGRPGEKTDQKTIFKLNEAIIKHYDAPRNAWATHLVSVKLEAVPEVFSNSKNESSVGIMFAISDPKALPEDAQKSVHELVSSQWFKELADDPFGLKTKSVAPEPTQVEVAPTEEDILADIPF